VKLDLRLEGIAVLRQVKLACALTIYDARKGDNSIQIGSRGHQARHKRVAKTVLEVDQDYARSLGWVIIWQVSACADPGCGIERQGGFPEPRVSIEDGNLAERNPPRPKPFHLMRFYVCEQGAPAASSRPGWLGTLARGKVRGERGCARGRF
jgi:hypothetical protein